jgi:protein-tyrosine phosphatase
VIVDAGGLRVEGGGYIRSGRLFRVSGALVVPDDLQGFERLGLRSLIDLRGAGEGRSLLEEWAAEARVRYVSLPIDVAGGGDLARAVTYAVDAYQAADALVALYREILDHHGRQLADAVAVIADGTPAAFGCSAGKDRTGLTAALVHLLLGADEADVVRSYASSPPSVERLRPLVADYLPVGLVEPPQLDVLLGAEEETLRRVLDHIRTRYGGASPYLAAHGLPEDAVDRLKRDLITDGRTPAA